MAGPGADKEEVDCVGAPGLPPRGTPRSDADGGVQGSGSGLLLHVLLLHVLPLLLPLPLPVDRALDTGDSKGSSKSSLGICKVGAGTRVTGRDTILMGVWLARMGSYTLTCRVALLRVPENTISYNFTRKSYICCMRVVGFRPLSPHCPRVTQSL